MEQNPPDTLCLIHLAAPVMYYKYICPFVSRSAIQEYYSTPRRSFRVNGEVAGYIKSVQNLRMFVMRNAGHMVPRSQPEYGYEMFSQFLDGTL